jgi:hypothetical protein
MVDVINQLVDSPCPIFSHSAEFVPKSIFNRDACAGASKGNGMALYCSGLSLSAHTKSPN